MRGYVLFVLYEAFYKENLKASKAMMKKPTLEFFCVCTAYTT